MNEIQLRLNENGRGSFFVEENGEIIAEMNVGIVSNVLTAYHTEVSDKLKGQGIGKRLLEAMVEHARSNHLKVIALCPFVYASFKQHPDLYADIWQKSIREQ
jgi:predicted GNAT family acetyltransferase